MNHDTPVGNRLWIGNIDVLRNPKAVVVHFVMPRSRVDSAPRQLELVLNWFDELNRLAPE